MEFDTFDPADFTAELATAGGNHDIGTAVLFENDRVRVWDLAVDPGQRLPFHSHPSTYFFVCVEGGRVINRMPDGNQVTADFADGDTWFSEHNDEPEIHDLENIDGTRVRFMTIELL